MQVTGPIQSMPMSTVWVRAARRETGVLHRIYPVLLKCQQLEPLMHSPTPYTNPMKKKKMTEICCYGSIKYQHNPAATG